MARTVKETANPNWSGLTMPSFEALNTPARPAVEAPRANARSLVVTVLTPELAAASSSSRTAIQARPRRDPWRRYTSIITTARMTIIVT